MIREEGIFDFQGRKVGKELLYMFDDRLVEKHKEHVFENLPEELDLEIFETHLSKLSPKTLNFVNLKPSTLLKYSDQIDKLLKKYSVPRENLVIEIREDFISNGDLKRVGLIANRLGVSVCIDDFGKGASNWERLKSLNPKFVKLDVVLFDKDVLELLTKTIKKILPRTTLIAEKVENKEIFNLSRNFFDLWQGFFESSLKDRVEKT